MVYLRATNQRPLFRPANLVFLFFLLAGGQDPEGLVCWILLGAALLVLATWPLIIWWHVSNGVPLIPAVFETLLWPLAALGLGLAAHGVWAALGRWLSRASHLGLAAHGV